MGFPGALILPDKLCGAFSFFSFFKRNKSLSTLAVLNNTAWLLSSLHAERKKKCQLSADRQQINIFFQGVDLFYFIIYYFQIYPNKSKLMHILIRKK